LLVDRMNARPCVHSIGWLFVCGEYAKDRNHECDCDDNYKCYINTCHSLTPSH